MSVVGKPFRGAKTRSLSVLTVLVLVVGLIAPSIAGAIEIATPKYVANYIVHHFNTPDGRPIVYTKCKGLTSGPHKSERGQVLFHVFQCGEVDSVKRAFLAHVTITSPTSMHVVAYACSARYSKVACPAGLH